MWKKDFLLRRIGISLLGLVLCGVSISLELFANLGVDPASVFQQGLSRTLGISYGMASALSNIIIIAVVFFVDRKYLNISTMLAIVSIGFTADFCTQFYASFISPEALPVIVRYSLVFLSSIIMGLGVSMYIRADLGVGAIDLVSEVTSAKTHFPYRWVRIATDILFVIVGSLLGGVFGVGTIILALCTGPMVQFLRAPVYRQLDRLLPSLA